MGVICAAHPPDKDSSISRTNRQVEVRLSNICLRLVLPLQALANLSKFRPVLRRSRSTKGGVGIFQTSCGSPDAVKSCLHIYRRASALALCANTPGLVGKPPHARHAAATPQNEIGVR